jgi:hypothetical protein
MLPTRPARFSFVDEGEAVRRLGIERDELLALVQSKQLRAYPGVNKGYFFRVSDLDALAAELHPEQASAEEKEEQEDEAPNPRKQHDPAFKVHLRLQADLKWYDLTDDDFRAYVRELHPSAYEKQRMNVTNIIAKLERLVAMMDEAAAGWKSQATQPVMFVKREKPAADATQATTGARKSAPKKEDDTPK